MLKLRGLQQRLAIFMFLPVALLLIGMGVAGFIYARDSMLAQWGEAATLKLQRATHEVDMRLSRAKEWLKMFHTTGDNPYAPYYHELIIEQLEGIGGVARVKVNWAAGFGPLEKEKRGLIPAMETAVVEITSPRYDSLVKNKTIALISDLKTETGRKIGQLEVVIAFDYFIGKVLSSGWDQSDRAYLVDKSGKILSSTGGAPGRSQLGENKDALELKTLTAMKDKLFGTVIDHGLTDANVSGFYRLQEAPWILIMIAPGKDILAPIIQFHWYYLVAGAVFILIILALIRLGLGHTVSSIQDLSKAAHKVSRGQFVTLHPPRAQDEVCELVCSFNTMVMQLEERIELKESLDLAMEVQQNLLPQKPLQTESLDIAGKSIYCDETGGDYFDYFQFPKLGKDKIGIAVGDVVGHGVPAALLMTTVRAFLRSRMAQTGNLTQKITDVNRLLCLDTHDSCDYMTLFLLVIDSLKNELKWVRAGHDPAFVYNPSTGSFTELDGNGMVLGIDEAFSFQEYKYSGWSDGQIIVIGTDGIWETENPNAEAFGKTRLRHIVRQNGHCSAKEILQAITVALSKFRETAIQNDDVTLVVVKAKS
jgi:sigma-B regulation protein RsbU (phosphoserine phosphatase)